MSSESQIPEHDIIGIKFGSSLTVLGTLNNRRVDVLYSDTSSREIPSLITFTKECRKYAEHAQSIYLKNIENSYNFLNRLIGLKEENNDIIEHEKKYIHNIINEDFTFGSENLKIESIVASFLFFLSKTWKNKLNNKKTNNIVISVPDYYTQYQRLILLNSIEISNLKCISLLNESSSVCLSYFLHHYKELDLNDNIICFIDLGESKLSIHFCLFNNSEARVIFSKSEKCFGCRDLDYSIYNYIKNKYNECNNLNNKTIIKLFQAIEKARKILTVNKDSNLLFEHGDLIISEYLTRDNFEEIIKNELIKFKEFLSNCLKESNISLKLINSFEMVGDAIRNPVFQKVIFDVFNKDIKKTLLADECIARGCALYNTMIDECYSTINDFTFYQYNQYDIILEIISDFVNDKIIVLKKGENFPIKRAYKFQKKDICSEYTRSVNFNFYFDNGKLKQISSYQLIFQPKSEDYTFIIQILIDNNCIPEVIKGDLELKTGYLIHCTKILVKKFTNSQISQNELIIKELEMEFNDYLNYALCNRKNEIESILYSIRDKKEDHIDITKNLEEIENINNIDDLDKKYFELKDKFNLTNNTTHIDIDKIIFEIINSLNNNKQKLGEKNFIYFGRELSGIMELVEQGNDVNKLNKLIYSLSQRIQNYLN